MIVTISRCPVHGPPEKTVFVQPGDVPRCPTCRLPLEKTTYGPVITREPRS